MTALQPGDIKIDIKVFLAKGEDRLGKERAVFALASERVHTSWGRWSGSRPAFHTQKPKSSKDLLWEDVGMCAHWPSCAQAGPVQGLAELGPLTQLSNTPL